MTHINLNDEKHLQNTRTFPAVDTAFMASAVPRRALVLAPGPDAVPAFPACSQFADVLGSRMHYVEHGSGDPILFLHGQPTWSYLWRNVLPELEGKGRLIAVDLIGYGMSDKPGDHFSAFTMPIR